MMMKYGATIEATKGYCEYFKSEGWCIQVSGHMFYGLFTSGTDES